MAQTFEADFELVVILEKHRVAGVKQRTDDSKYRTADEAEVFAVANTTHAVANSFIHHVSHSFLIS